MFRYLYENIVGGGAGGWTKIEDGVDNISLFSLEVCDTRCQVVVLGSKIVWISGVEACLQRLLLVWLLQRPTVIDRGPRLKASAQSNPAANSLRTSTC